MVVKRKSTKNPPMLSHEFVIQNHADIVACVAMVFVVGLMFQVSSPLASLFIALHHNVSVPMEVLPGQIQDVVHYTAGAKASFNLKLNDICLVLSGSFVQRQKRIAIYHVKKFVKDSQ